MLRFLITFSLLGGLFLCVPQCLNATGCGAQEDFKQDESSSVRIPRSEILNDFRELNN